MDMFTPSEIVYSAWEKTKKPLLYNTSDGKKSITKEVVFANPQENENFNADFEGICSMCGKEFRGGIPLKKLIGKTYTDMDIHKAPEETHICEACAFCLMTSKIGLERLSRYSFVANNEELHLCNRAEMRDMLLNPPKPPFAAACAVTQKKHLIGKVRVSYSQERYFCNYEETPIEIKAEEFKHNVDTIETLCGLGITKTEIETATLKGNRYKDLGFKMCAKILDVIENLKKYSALQIALFVAQKKDEEVQNEGYTIPR